MQLNGKNIAQISRLVHYTIALALCWFLILLSNKIIADLDTVATSPVVETFENTAALQQLDDQEASLTKTIEKLTSQKSVLERAMALANANYENEKKSFDNWLRVRKTLGSPDKDQEVTARVRQLDEFYKVEQAWRVQLDARQSEINQQRGRQQQVQARISEEKDRAAEKYEAALRAYDFKVFLLRLGFALPILGLGIFFFVRYRRHQLWPLFLGFVLFSVYVFFVGLVPYLPSYGGYVRYLVGIMVSVGLGYYAIKHIRQYLERKQEELKISTAERAKNVQTDVAEKALDNHFCPSCSKDFFVKKWEFPPNSNAANEAYRLVTNFCRHCGLELFRNCSVCQNKNFAHLPFCSACGTKQSVEVTA